MADDVELDLANHEAEDGVLGSLLLSPREAIPVVARMLKPDDFTQADHRTLYDVILALFARRESPDFLLVHDEYNRRGLPFPATLYGELVQCVPHGLHAESYAERVRDMAIRRRYVEAAGEIVRTVYRTDTSLADLAQCTDTLLQTAAATVDTGAVPLADVIWSEFDQIGQPLGQTLSTGWPDLDLILRGIKRGQLVLIAARPSVGKSAMAAQIAAHVSRDHAVGIISLEMTNREIVDRLVAIESGADMYKFRAYAGTDVISEPEMERVTKTFADLSTRPIVLHDSNSGELADVVHQARRMRKDARIELLIVDHMHLMSVSGRENRTQELTRISRAMKRLAAELKIPVIALAQLNRQVEYRADSRPMLADLRESGSLEQDADVVILIHRETVAQRDMPLNPETEFIVAKHRNGPTGVARVVWRPETASFGSLSRREAGR